MNQVLKQHVRNILALTGQNKLEMKVVNFALAFFEDKNTPEGLCNQILSMKQNYVTGTPEEKADICKKFKEISEKHCKDYEGNPDDYDGMDIHESDFVGNVLESPWIIDYQTLFQHLDELNGFEESKQTITLYLINNIIECALNKDTGISELFQPLEYGIEFPVVINLLSELKEIFALNTTK